ncbi:30S ribosomal protein S18 [Candidatus Parcubacteria bacterium]|nr:30S ribosomal protein S18 [Candidatus Parcubacteria bacterium]
MSEKQCFFKENNIEHIDYKDVHVLKQFVNPNGRIIGSKRSAVSAKMQRRLAKAIKRARFMALMPYINR